MFEHCELLKINFSNIHINIYYINLFLELKSSLSKNYGVFNVKNENTKNTSQQDKTKEINNVEVKKELVNIKQENEKIKTDNEDEQNVKVDVTTCSPTEYVISYF